MSVQPEPDQHLGNLDPFCRFDKEIKKPSDFYLLGSQAFQDLYFIDLHHTVLSYAVTNVALLAIRRA